MPSEQKKRRILEFLAERPSVYWNLNTGKRYASVPEETRVAVRELLDDGLIVKRRGNSSPFLYKITSKGMEWLDGGEEPR